MVETTNPDGVSGAIGVRAASSAVVASNFERASVRRAVVMERAKWPGLATHIHAKVSERNSHIFSWLLLIRVCVYIGEWGCWSDWSPCSVSCGVGSRHRARKCLSMGTDLNGSGCEGSSVEYGECEQPLCDCKCIVLVCYCDHDPRNTLFRIHFQHSSAGAIGQRGPRAMKMANANVSANVSRLIRVPKSVKAMSARFVSVMLNPFKRLAWPPVLSLLSAFCWWSRRPVRRPMSCTHL